MHDYTELGPYVAGEIPEPWVHTFLDADGAVIDLTGYAVRLTYKIDDDVQVVRVGSLATDGTDGKARYVWVVADFSTVGLMAGEMTVGNGTNRFARRFKCIIYAPLGGALPTI